MICAADPGWGNLVTGGIYKKPGGTFEPDFTDGEVELLLLKVPSNSYKLQVSMRGCCDAITVILSCSPHSPASTEVQSQNCTLLNP